MSKVSDRMLFEFDTRIARLKEERIRATFKPSVESALRDRIYELEWGREQAERLMRLEFKIRFVQLVDESIELLGLAIKHLKKEG